MARVSAYLSPENSSILYMVCHTHVVAVASTAHIDHEFDECMKERTKEWINEHVAM